MRRIVLVPLLSVALGAVAAPPSPAGVEAAAEGHLALAPLDLPALRAQDEQRDAQPGTPRRYGVLQALPPQTGALPAGAWSTLPDGRLQWRLTVDAPGADNLAFGFARFRLPARATLVVRDAQGEVRLGPYTEADNPRDGVLHTPALAGEQAVLELTLPAAQREFSTVQLGHVVQGYRPVVSAGAAAAKAGSCNIDVACPQGDDYRDQIASVALYTFSSGGSAFACSGTLVATGDRAQDLAAPRFLTANHCVDTAAEAQSMVFYWGYESPTCRTPGSAASGTPLPRSANTRVTQSGATLLATHVATDFTVVQLAQPVPAAAQAYYSGWDRSGIAPPASVGIHHAEADEKRITFNDDPLTTMPSCIRAGTASNTHWRIEEYEAGTTEVGSSGSGLWADLRDEGTGEAEDERLIGVLSGGDASCSAPQEYDCYGRLSQAWSGGGTPATRMRDWLDRGGGAPPSVAGMKAACTPPTLSLESPAFAAPPTAGANVTFTAVAGSGGAGNRVFHWDVDGDGTVDRSGAASTLQVAYPRAGQFQVLVRLSDDGDCDATASRALDVRGAVLAATAGAPQQVCGDGDAAIEPGERWKLPVTLRNDGGAALPAGGRALFARQTVHAPARATADVNDNGFGPFDDARTADPIVLGGGGLRLYGQTYAQAFMSTNGYVSFSPDESGADWSNACGGGLDNGATGPQLRPLHDDLEVLSERPDAGLRYAWLPVCPRPPQTAPAQQGCHVFQWSHLGWNDSDDTSLAPTGDATFQAIVYQPSGQIVYQYLTADTHAGGRATLGVIGAGGDPLDVACNVANAAPAGRAVCLFDPAAAPTGGFPAGTLGPNQYGYRAFTNAGGAACPFQPVNLEAAQAAGGPLRLETPTVALPALEPGAQAAVEVGFALPETAACGGPLGFDYIGSAAPGLSSFARSALFGATTGAGSCQVVAGCAAQIPAIATRNGFYYNAQRSGNGLANFVYGNVYGGVWYTALADRSPTWYILNGDYADHLGVLPIRRFENPAAPDGFAPASRFVGTAWVAQVDRDTVLQAWEFADGAAGLELVDAPPQPFTDPNHSQTWYSTAESGWGLSVESLVTGPSSVLEFMVGYLYDAQGTARWVLGTDDSTSGGDAPLSVYRTHCPSCPWLVDWAASEQPAGSLGRVYTGPTSMLFSSQIALPPPLSGSWNRSNLPLTTIGPPAPPGE